MASLFGSDEKQAINPEYLPLTQRSIDETIIELEATASKSKRQKQRRVLKIVVLNVLSITLAMLIVALLATISITLRPKPALLILKNSRIWTGDAKRQVADALAVGLDGRIAFVGDSATVEQRFYALNSTVVIDHSNSKDQRLVLPGLIDSHIHLLIGGRHLMNVQLSTVKSKEEFRQKIIEFVANLEPGKWILGGDWDSSLWTDGELPTKLWLDDITPNNPVYLWRIDGHMAVCNSLALQLAEITRDTPDPEGGVIGKDARGELTGIVKDNAMFIVDKAVVISPEDDDKAMALAQDYALRTGVTSVYNMGTFAELEVFKRTKAQGNLRVRLHHAVDLKDWKQLRDVVARDGRGDDFLSIGGLKGYMDGSLGSHTALMFDPYDDAPTERGLQLTSDDSLNTWIREADAAGMQVCVHAIGDRGVSKILDLFDNVTAINGPRDRRFRVEHAQQIRQQDRDRFSKGNYIASMQPLHLVADLPWAHKAIGPQRIFDLYLFNSMNKQSQHSLVFGSDWFVAPIEPPQHIHAAVTRITTNYPNGFNTPESISIEDSLRAFTVNGAWGMFKENKVGRILPGMLGDIVILDQNILASDFASSHLLSTNVLTTIIGGKVVYQKNEAGLS